MLCYMLDTDTCSYIMKRSNDAVLKRLQEVRVSDVCISVITKSELLFGVELSTIRTRPERMLDVGHFTISFRDSPAFRPLFLRNALHCVCLLGASPNSAVNASGLVKAKLSSVVQRRLDRCRKN